MSEEPIKKVCERKELKKIVVELGQWGSMSATAQPQPYNSVKGDSGGSGKLTLSMEYGITTEDAKAALKMVEDTQDIDQEIAKKMVTFGGRMLIHMNGVLQIDYTPYAEKAQKRALEGTSMEEGGEVPPKENMEQKAFVDVPAAPKARDVVMECWQCGIPAAPGPEPLCARHKAEPYCKACYGAVGTKSDGTPYALCPKCNKRVEKYKTDGTGFGEALDQLRMQIAQEHAG